MQLDYNFNLILLIFLRMSGCIFFNPIFGRKNVPMIVKIGLSLMLTFFVYSFVETQSVIVFDSFIVLFFIALKELMLGFILGFIIQLFLSVLVLAGEFMDMQIGISMSKIYDPASNVSMPLTASMLNSMFMIIFFLSNSHLTLVQVFMHSGKAIPFGTLTISPEIYKMIALMFSNMLIYAVKMSMPLLGVELITEMGVGLIMKAVPQINVFIVNIQLKLVIGFIMIFILVAPFSAFIEKLFTLMFDNIDAVFKLLA